MHFIVQNTVLYNGVKELLQELHGKYKMGIITNGLKEAQRPRLAKVGITDFFEVIVVSDEIGFAKPGQAYFDFVHEKIEKVEKEKVLVIGDNPKSDILGANNFGYKSCWINSKEKTAEERSDFEISTVLHLPQVLSTQNISCNLYDELEIKATSDKKIEITYINAMGKESNTTSRIKTLETKNKKEYLITNEDEKIRLDRIINLIEK